MTYLTYSWLCMDLVSRKSKYLTSSWLYSWRTWLTHDFTYYVLDLLMTLCSCEYTMSCDIDVWLIRTCVTWIYESLSHVSHGYMSHCHMCHKHYWCICVNEYWCICVNESYHLRSDMSLIWVRHVCNRYMSRCHSGDEPYSCVCVYEVLMRMCVWGTHAYVCMSYSCVCDTPSCAYLTSSLVTHHVLFVTHHVLITTWLTHHFDVLSYSRKLDLLMTLLVTYLTYSWLYLWRTWLTHDFVWT